MHSFLKAFLVLMKLFHFLLFTISINQYELSKQVINQGGLVFNFCYIKIFRFSRMS